MAFKQSKAIWSLDENDTLLSGLQSSGYVQTKTSEVQAEVLSCSGTLVETMTDCEIPSFFAKEKQSDPTDTSALNRSLKVECRDREMRQSSFTTADDKSLEDFVSDEIFTTLPAPTRAN